MINQMKLKKVRLRVTVHMMGGPGKFRSRELRKYSFRAKHATRAVTDNTKYYTKTNILYNSKYE